MEDCKEEHISRVVKGGNDIEKTGDDPLLQDTRRYEDTESDTSLLSRVTTPIGDSTATIKRWLPPPPPTDLTFTAIPCYVDLEGHIFLQPKTNVSTVNFIRESQTLLFSGSSPEDEDLCWQPGDAVVARFHLDKKWYRAIVHSLEKNSKVRVTFVDYGNPELVKVNEIRTRLIHTNIPIQCYKAVLNDVMPASDDGKWDTKLLDFIHLSLVEKECLVTIVEPPKLGDILKVNLKLLTVDLDVTSFLVDELGACRRFLPPPKEEDPSSEDVIIESEDELGKSESESKSDESITVTEIAAAPHPYLPVDEMFYVQVSAIQDPSHVFIMPINGREVTTHHQAWATQRITLKQFLDKIPNDPHELRVSSDPVIGEIYLTHFNDNQWVRAEVEEVNKETVSLLYIDFGHREEVPRENVYECPLEGKKISRGAQLVRLSGVEPPGGPGSEWSVASMEAMIQCLLGPKKQCFLACVVEIEVGQTTGVELYEMDASQLLTLAYSDLIKDGIINFKGKKAR